jgi:hypothetical protein
MKGGDEVTRSDDAFEQELRSAFAVGVPEPKYAADSADSEEVPESLAFSVVARARERSTELLAERLREAAEASGWTVDQLASEARDQEGEARDFLRGWKSPRSLRPHLLARVFWRSELKPQEWQTLLTQAVASSFFFAAPTEEQVWGRATGLPDEDRAEALATRGERDPDRAARVARIFVEEVIEEWTTLMSGTKTTDEDESE